MIQIRTRIGRKRRTLMTQKDYLYQLKPLDIFLLTLCKMERIIQVNTVEERYKKFNYSQIFEYSKTIFGQRYTPSKILLSKGRVEALERKYVECIEREKKNAKAFILTEKGNEYIKQLVETFPKEFILNTFDHF